MWLSIVMCGSGPHVACDTLCQLSVALLLGLAGDRTWLAILCAGLLSLYRSGRLVAARGLRCYVRCWVRILILSFGCRLLCNFRSCSFVVFLNLFLLF